MASAILSAIALMMCCWEPTLLIGISGMSEGARCFSWVRPLRPYFFGLAFISLSYSFYQVYKPQNAEGGCPNCKQNGNKFGDHPLNHRIFVT